ncbi:uncharacterized protein LOC117502116 [Thalassophryne amazonica]|uniref:uncharacterized protein LOC117502116 n=1 Tax=Thalassophryne amazonica TaxID=390379 RepID=UPI001471F734|nr:uncharacterized protein LOC117502116 [Thalassophryne amazonica]
MYVTLFSVSYSLKRVRCFRPGFRCECCFRVPLVFRVVLESLDMKPPTVTEEVTETTLKPMMAKPKWILTFLCVTVQQLVKALPALHSALEVQVRQNISLVCNLSSSSTEITWYRLQLDQLLPVVTKTRGKMGDVTTINHGEDEGRFSISTDSGFVSLEILQVQEVDAGLYFCSGPCEGITCFKRGIHLTVGDVWVEPDKNQSNHTCLTLWICVLAVVVLMGFLGFFLCSGKPFVCCYRPVGGDSWSKVTENAALQYSSVKCTEKPRPSVQCAPRLAEDVPDRVIYSSVASNRNQMDHMSNTEKKIIK